MRTIARTIAAAVAVAALAPGVAGAHGARSVLTARLFPADASSPATGIACFKATRRGAWLSVKVRRVAGQEELAVAIDGAALEATIAIAGRKQKGKLRQRGDVLSSLDVRSGSTVELLGPDGTVVLRGVFAAPGERVPEVPPPEPPEPPEPPDVPDPPDSGEPPATPDPLSCSGSGPLRHEARLEASPGIDTPASGRARLEACPERPRLCVDVEDVVTDPQVAEVTVEVVQGDAVILVDAPVPVSGDARRRGALCIDFPPGHPLAATVAGAEVHVLAGGSPLLKGVLEAE
jgi:hypothetical protein